MFQQLLLKFTEHLYTVDQTCNTRLRRACWFLYAKIHPDTVRLIRETTVSGYSVPHVGSARPASYVTLVGKFAHIEFQKES